MQVKDAVAGQHSRALPGTWGDKSERAGQSIRGDSVNGVQPAKPRKAGCIYNYDKKIVRRIEYNLGLLLLSGHI